MVQRIAQFTCDMCGKEVKKAGKYKLQQPQYVADHTPDILTVCRTCIYKETFPKKGIMLKKRDNLIEDGIILDGEPYTNRT